MPTITVSAGALTIEKKKELMRRLTEVSIDVTGAPEQFHTVFINEYPLDSMSVGYQTVEEIVESMKK